MIKETVSIIEKKTELTVTNSKISATLRSNVQKTGIRMYGDGAIGIAGAIGAYDDKELSERAKSMLKFKAPYEPSPTKNAVRSLDLSTQMKVTDQEFVENSRKLLGVLNQRFPNFMFSNTIALNEKEISLKNDVGTELFFKDRGARVMLAMKFRESKNLIDGFGYYMARDYKYEDLVDLIAKQCDIYENLADFSEEFQEIPVVFIEPYTIGSKFFKDLHGEFYGAGASLLAGKIGEKLFSDKFTLLVNRDSKDTYDCFFDGEGTTLENDSFALIDKGTLVSPYTNKKIAHQFKFPTTGSAQLDYDAPPSASPMSLSIAKSEHTIKELLGGQKAILALMASGGDFTPQGEFASPIQVAYMFDGENLLGRLPQLSMASNIFDMFGKDFIGSSKDGILPNSPINYHAINMKVRKIDTWL